MGQIQLYIGLMLVFFSLIIVVVDLVLTSCELPTISHEIRRLAASNPWIPLSVGMLVGHLFL